LTNLSHRFRAIVASGREIDPEAATAQLLAMTAIVTRDFGGWRQIYAAKTLTLPA
jgi:hypothetical protein